MKIFHISDTHSHHGMLSIPDDMDILIHSGDSTNYRDWIKNQPEFEEFIGWMALLPIKNKILIAGNHDAWANKQYNVQRVKDSGIIYLEHEYIEVEGIRIFGSPYTPTFGEWHFMKDRSKLDRWWKQIPEGIDILITHGPPMGILDNTRERDGTLKYVGDSALLKHVLRIKPKYHLFGHIHNYEDCYNQGIRIFQDITFINASVVTDGKFGTLSSHGITINYE